MYAIVPSAAVGTGLGNYTISYASGELAVAPAALTITAESTSKTYGQAVTLTGTEFTESGLVNGDTIASVTMTSAGAAATAVVAGSPYAIVASGAVGTGLGNYTINYRAGELTIAPATLTVIASDKTMAFGGQVPALTVSYVGFVNGDTPANLTTPVEVSTSVTSDSPAGTYSITVGGASSPDYTIHYFNGTVTEESYVPPAQSRDRAAAAFVTTLYDKIADEEPEPVAFFYWMGRYLAHESPMKITKGFAQAIESASGNARSAPGISLRPSPMKPRRRRAGRAGKE